ncbi:hypothetical protein MMPV_003277 [Pyropia vietnamensis]
MVTNSAADVPDWGASISILHRGRPLPYGCSATACVGNGGVGAAADTSGGSSLNFSIFAKETTHAVLLLFPPTTAAPTPDDGDGDSDGPVVAAGAAAPVELRLDASQHRTGMVWHVAVAGVPPRTEYLWRIGAAADPRWYTNECLDPYARKVSSPTGADMYNATSVRGDYRPRGVVPSVGAPEFDWQGVVPPRIPHHQLVIYEMHVRGFTLQAGAAGTATAASRGGKDQGYDGGGGAGTNGTFLGVIDKIPYLRALGVNCVELLPVMEFNEMEWSFINPVTKQRLSQYWGYSTVAFFSPMNRFARTDATAEFQTMVRELHRAGIEVILDVVYNHTAEMGLDFLPPGHYGQKTLAPGTYYMLEDNGTKFVNYSGCGNTLSCNNPVTAEWIHESLRYWALSMGVDGFRFDLASILTRGTDGVALANPPVVERITKDPCMRDVKLIAEPWDCGGLYQVGTFPHYGVWSEWNGKFRDVVRQFVKGDHGLKGVFASRLCGSQDMYGPSGRAPYHSINFVTAHDGFSLYDLVSYNDKHNEHNGENNNDGEQHNNSWNCGVEGETSDPKVRSLRDRQMRNMMVALLISAGTPMLCMGDEYGHTKGGNNNGWCQDGLLTAFDWAALRDGLDGLPRFFAKLIRLRTQTAPFLARTTFYTGSEIVWHGERPGEPAWDDAYNFLAFTIPDPRSVGGAHLYVAFNAGAEARTATLPPAPVGGSWGRLVDTALPSPRDFSDDPVAHPIESTYGLAPYSAVVLVHIRRACPEATAVEDVMEVLRAGLDGVGLSEMGH